MQCLICSRSAGSRMLCIYETQVLEVVELQKEYHINDDSETVTEADINDESDVDGTKTNEISFMSRMPRSFPPVRRTKQPLRI